MKPAGQISPYFLFDKNLDLPFYQQIYEGYREAILSGRLRPGQRLPSTRSLAAELQISRLPVINAFDQLRHEGYIAGKTGDGTYVIDTIPDDLAHPVMPSTLKSGGRTETDSMRSRAIWRLPPQETILGAFRVSLPAVDLFPHKIWARLISRHAKSPTADLMAYAHPAGYMPLRIAIAQYLQTARAVHCNPEQILIVSGSQMALQICTRALLRPFDSVCVEEPGYPGAKSALSSTGSTIIPIRVDEYGMDVQEVAKRGKKARAVYVTPSHQYPLGVSMSASRRLELLDWAERQHAWIIEDDYDSEYRYASRPVASLQGMEPSGPVIYIGTFSKVLFPSLRIGYIVAPTSLISSFIKIREALDIFSPLLYQLALTDFLEDGHFGRHLRRMRTLYFSRRNSLLQNMDQFTGKILRPYNTDAGMHLSAFLPKGFNDHKIVRTAAAQGISVNDLSSCYAGPSPRNGLILGFACAEESKIRAGVQLLAEILRK